MRPGHSLAEALCALALGGVLAAAAGASLHATRRALDSAEDRERGARAEREAVAIVRQALEGGAAVLLRGDTAVELDLLLGSATLCAVESRALWLPWPQAGGMTALPQLPTADDMIALREWSPGADEWWYALVDSVQTRQAATPCASDDGWRASGDASPLLRLVLADTVPTLTEPGAELRVYRRGRFALYHIGGGEWALGWRRCHPWTTACSPIQPVAGPLVPPGAGGFRVTAAVHPDRWVLSARGVGGRGAAAEVLW